ncbi:Dipeptidyl aminopeptidase/acylaminoacyl peptidase [Aquiflexum balticum DSM 16537]|uniref:Dipeptidyl aminopeptidase/acylaminoacyl peptidase n=1 Tax=Aquiflexum balticum DSM 16537 TaxID=758820 RepID=A0A1W2GZC5_9BACT|nr:S9 family peptidase [Aquiflexum balticum]SMD41961.1 Dipeptidyl aminopeptidase/acylaminoacyl peptidase [Aquiflexum balticum DSM 16537]
MRLFFLTLIAFAPVGFVLSQQQKKSPSFEEVISLRNAGQVVISPDGEAIAFTLQTADWVENRFDTEIWMVRNGSAPIQITNSPKNNSTSPEFSPDGKWLAFLSDRGNKVQVYALRLSGGEAFPVTDEDEGINAFQWHPDGKRLVIHRQEKEDPSIKEKKKRYGAYEIDDQEFVLSHLWEIDFDPNFPDPAELPCYAAADSLKKAEGCIERPKAKKLTNGDFTITSFQISPDGKRIVFNHQPDPLITSSMKSDISLYHMESGEIKPLVSNAGADRFQTWSPDSKEILFTTNLDDTVSNYYTNTKIFRMDIGSSQTFRLAEKLDENPSNLVWNEKGIYGAFWKKTLRPIYRIDPINGSYQMLSGLPDIVNGFAFSKKGEKFALNARNGDQLNEIWLAVNNSQSLIPKKISQLTDQIKNWQVAQSEIVIWRSIDGTLIEGVLHKPEDYDPAKKYPLMVVIHGGPTGIDTPQPVPAYVYPVVQWLNKGALVLRPNYRGSAGYGEAFRSLNVENLGVGDAWDVMTGVDFLSAKGMIDTDKIGVMGWSQGGYISAFLTTNTDRFKAISVGAGISNWMTYYVNTDIHPFTIQYLKANPWDNEEIYKKTSPMTTIKKAVTPTLIQHGEFDKRVPIPNAYELLQGLRDQGVPAELIVYKGFGHGITKPKERLAATWHNWQWFGKYVWGEEIEMPLTEK